MKHSWFFLVLALLVACQPVTTMPSPVPISAATPENAPTPVPTLETPVRYELRQPQPNELLKMIDSVLLMEEQMTYQEDVTTAILEREPNSLHYLIGRDFERYYLN